MLLENKKVQGKAGLLCACVAAALLAACTSSLEARLSGTGPALERAAFSAELSPAAERLAGAFLGQEAIFEAAAIEAAFEAIPFPSPASVRVEGKGGDKLKLEFLRINLNEGIFLNLTDGDTKAFDAGKNSFAITLTKETIAKTVAALPAELFEYVDLLMIPVLTGESMSEDEYIALISAAYGPQAAAELAASSFALTVQCPAKVTGASAREFAAGTLGGASAPAAHVEAKAAGTEARFAIPAVKVFTLSCPLQLVVEFGV